MSPQGNTERADYRFVVKEFADGTPWIVLEPMRGDLSVLGNGFLGLDLVKGTDLKKAHEVADFLNEAIHSVSYTRL